MACGKSSAYSASVYNWVEQFHSFPHIDSKLKTVSSDFAPRNRTYVEGAAFTGGLCVLAGLALFLFVLVFLCLCWYKNRKRGEYDRFKSKPGCHWSFAMAFALLCCGGLALSFFGNEYVKDGIDTTVKAIKSGNQTVKEGQEKVGEIRAQLQTSYSTLGALSDDWQGKGLPQEVVQQLVDQTGEAQSRVGTAEESAGRIYDTINDVVDGAKYADDLKKYDDYRWKGTLGAMSAVVAILILMVIGVCLASTCTLKLTEFLLLFALLVAWITAGVFVAIAVMGADFCISPNDAVDQELEGKSYEDTVKYYIYCQNCPNPFEADYDNIIDSLDTIQSQLESLKSQAEEYQQLQDAVRDITTLQASLIVVENKLQSLWHNEVNCTQLNRDYNIVIDAACDKIVDGSVFTFFGGGAIGLGVFFLLLAIQRHWTRIAASRDWFEGEGARLLEPAHSRHRQRRDQPQTRAHIQQFRADIDASRKEGVKFPGEPPEAWTDESSKV